MVVRGIPLVDDRSLGGQDSAAAFGYAYTALSSGTAAAAG